LELKDKVINIFVVVFWV